MSEKIVLAVLAGVHFTCGQISDQIDFEPIRQTIPDIEYAECSKKSNFGNQRIFQGTHVTTHSWPWIVHLDVYDHSYTAEYNKGLCSGTIISENHILTAAHCCRLEGNTDKVNKIRATFGRLTNKEADTSIEFSMMIESENIFAHEEFLSLPPKGAGKHDVCVLKTKDDIMAARPKKCVEKNCAMVACIADAPIDDLVGKNCWVAGWGFTDPDAFRPSASDNLLQAGVNIFSRDYCLAKSTRKYKKRLRSDEICAGTPDQDNNGKTDRGPDTCQGDSGGPLMCLLGSEETLFLVGVTSWGDGCGKEGSPGVYSSISEHFDFIQNKVMDSPRGSTPGPDVNETTTCPTPDRLQIELDDGIITMNRDKTNKKSCSSKSYISQPIVYSGRKNRSQYFLFKHTASSAFTLFRTRSRTRFSCTRKFEILAESEDTQCIESDLSWYSPEVPGNFQMQPGQNSQKLRDFPKIPIDCKVTF